ncbi:MAG: hypothetical protein GXP35_13475 [Actinobacteria bacterium]|nr:hypothetical protein [Actinomycetota bacterium]
MSPVPVAAATPAALWALRHIRSAAVGAWTPPRIDGNRASALVRVLGETIRQRRLDPVEFGTFDVETVFDMVNDARAEGQDARAEFDPDLGHPTRLVIVDQGVEILDLVSRSFRSAVQEPACETGTGSPLDLSDEPLAKVLSSTIIRWQDREGCPVRFDEISDHTGSPHCDMDGADFLTIGTPVGSIPEPEAARGYVVDPDRTLARIGHGQWGSIAGLDTAAGTGYRSAEGFELWINEADTEYVWEVNGSTVQAWRQTPPNVFLYS